MRYHKAYEHIEHANPFSHPSTPHPLSHTPLNYYDTNRRKILLTIQFFPQLHLMDSQYSFPYIDSCITMYIIPLRNCFEKINNNLFRPPTSLNSLRALFPANQYSNIYNCTSELAQSGMIIYARSPIYYIIKKTLYIYLHIYMNYIFIV